MQSRPGSGDLVRPSALVTGPGSVRSEQPGFPGTAYRVAPVTYPELAETGPEMRLDRIYRDEQLVSDLLRAEQLSGQTHHGALPFGEWFDQGERLAVRGLRDGDRAVWDEPGAEHAFVGIGEIGVAFQRWPEPSSLRGERQ